MKPSIRKARQDLMSEQETMQVSMDLTGMYRLSKSLSDSTYGGSSDASTAAATESESTDSEDSSEFVNTCSKSRVRFLVDNKGKMMEDVYSYDAVPHRLRRKVFLSQEQLSLKKRAARSYCNLYSRIHPNYSASIDYLFESPLRKEVPQNMDPAEAHAILAISEARGMERHVNDLMMRHQRFARRAVLHCHKELQSCDYLTQYDKDEILRERSLELSHCTTRFARILAEGDESEAICIYAGGYEI
jgi:hypothetical protein